MSLSVAVFILRPLSLNNNFFLLQNFGTAAKFFPVQSDTEKYLVQTKESFGLSPKERFLEPKEKKHFTCCFTTTDYINFLQYTPAHPRLLIKSIPYRQAFCLQNICAKTSELSKNLLVLKESFIN